MVVVHCTNEFIVYTFAYYIPKSLMVFTKSHVYTKKRRVDGTATNSVDNLQRGSGDDDKRPRKWDRKMLVIHSRI